MPGTATLPATRVERQAPAIARVGVLSQGVLERAGDLPPFRQGLRDLGYFEDENLVLELRYAEGQLDRLPALATDLVKGGVDVIWATSSPAIRAAMDATSTIPIVMGVSSDPVEQGFVSSLNRPGGNVTGLTSMSLQLSGKRLEVLAEVVPGLSRVAVLWDPSAPGKPAEWQQTQDTARYLHLEMISLEVRSPEEFDAAFAAAASERADALIILGGPMFQSNHARLVELTTRHRLPAIYETSVLARRGGLVAYGPVTEDLFYRSANFVDRILKGGKPADLPVERPTRFYLVVNLGAARAIDLTIPQAVLLNADDAIQ